MEKAKILLSKLAQDKVMNWNEVGRCLTALLEGLQEIERLDQGPDLINVARK